MRESTKTSVLRRRRKISWKVGHPHDGRNLLDLNKINHALSTLKNHKKWFLKTKSIYLFFAIGDKTSTLVYLENRVVNKILSKKLSVTLCYYLSSRLSLLNNVLQILFTIIRFRIGWIKYPECERYVNFSHPETWNAWCRWGAPVVIHCPHVPWRSEDYGTP